MLTIWTWGDKTCLYKPMHFTLFWGLLYAFSHPLPNHRALASLFSFLFHSSKVSPAVRGRGERGQAE